MKRDHGSVALVVVGISIVACAAGLIACSSPYEGDSYESPLKASGPRKAPTEAGAPGEPSTDPTDEATNPEVDADAGGSGGSTTVVIDDGGGAPGGATCGDTKASFVAAPINPTAGAKVGVCTPAGIDALAKACATDLASVACANARNINPTCAGCVFGLKTDPTWKSIVFQPGEPTPAVYNQAGCIWHVTDVAGCGKKYMTLVRCLNNFCGTCKTTAEAQTCLSKVQTEGKCSAVQFTAADQACATAIQTNKATIDTKCFPTGNTAVATETLFKEMATLQCPGT